MLLALGVGKVVRANPFRLREAMEKVREAAAFKGVSAVLFESPCINLAPRPKTLFAVDAAACTGCRACIGQIGCPCGFHACGQGVYRAVALLRLFPVRAGLPARGDQSVALCK